MGGLFDIISLNKRLLELDVLIKSDDFWLDIDNANAINKEYVDVKKTIDKYNDIKDNLDTLCLLQTEMDDTDIQKELTNLANKIESFEILVHLNGKYDKLNCYLEIHPGAGGTESCDWASMLLRMYQRFCEKNNYKYEIISKNDGEEAGIKSVLMHVIGDSAYGYLKGENGIHRLVRISPFDSNKRRHTSFASVTIMPEFKETKAIEINEADLKIDVYHSSGAGGQSVNTSNSAVRITHLPSKIVVTCQNERSQLKNKETALKILKNKLFEKQIEAEQKLKNELNVNNLNIDFGSQIRSYVLEPYKLVKDVRSNFESTNPEKILDGDLREMLDYNLKNLEK